MLKITAFTIFKMTFLGVALQNLGAMQQFTF